MHPAPTSEIPAQLIALFAALMLVAQLLLAVQRMLLTSIRLFAIQSLFLAGSPRLWRIRTTRSTFMSSWR